MVIGLGMMRRGPNDTNVCVARVVEDIEGPCQRVVLLRIRRNFGSIELILKHFSN